MIKKLVQGLTLEEQDRAIVETMERERGRLRSFVRSRVMDLGDAEDVLQDVFYEFTQAYRMMKPAEQAGAWLFRVARNRIIDLFRRKKADSLSEPAGGDEDGLLFEDLLPSPDAGPDAEYARKVMVDALGDAIEALPAKQRAVFVAQEVDGKSFREIAEETGESINTLLSRKRRAVLALRESLKEFEGNWARR